MRLKAHYIFFFFSFFAILDATHVLFAQDTANPAKPYYLFPLPFPNPDYPTKIDSSNLFHPRLMQPIIGIGPGILTFYGDISDKFTFAPSRLSYHLTVSEYLTPYLSISARAMFGTLGANESGPRFANFQSTIRSGGINFSYNFDNFLPKKRMIDPFILTGIEYFEFLSKTDLFDASGNKYYYWNDGSIKNLPQNDPHASSAIILSRDYKYETDIRKLNKELFGKYPERSFAIPVGIGFTMHVHPRWDFKMGTTMHFTFTDYIDGITPANKGAGTGKPNKDKFLETYFTICFHIFNPQKDNESTLSDDEFLALENEDTDGDGVTDFKDSCQGTPPGISVNAFGCPPDDDGDGIPNYLDKEVNSPAGAFIDANGVAMDDSTIARNWREWSDPDQYVVYTTVTNPPAVTGEGWTKKRDATIVYSDRGYNRGFVVLLGKYKEGIPPSEMGKLLSVHDVKSYLQPDSSTAYAAGSFDKSDDAEKRKKELSSSGFPNAKVMMRNKDGSLTEATSEVLPGLNAQDKKDVSFGNGKGIVYRVQLGAYSKKLSSAIFNNAGQIIELKSDDGLYKYMSGSHSSVQDALKHRDELLKQGYQGAFVVAYKDGKRIPLSSATGGMVQPKNENMEEAKTPKSAIDKNLVFFSIQVGAFLNEPPADIMQKMSKIPGLDKKKKSTGVTQYIAGKFHDLKSAQKFKEEIVSKYGIHDAFLVAYFKNEMISMQEASELLK